PARETTARPGRRTQIMTPRSIWMIGCSLLAAGCSPTTSAPGPTESAAPASPSPPVAGFAPVAATLVAAGTIHSCAVRSGGSVACWGYNGHGQLGDGTRSDRLEPTAVQGLRGAVSVAVGWQHSC